MSRARQKVTAWIAAAALLFSALSPAMASALFAGRPDIMARVMGLPAQHAAAQPAAEHGDGCPHEVNEVHAAATAAHHGAAGSPADDSGEHAAHGIYCSFCLAASAQLGVLPAPPVPATPFVGVAQFIPAGKVQAPAANLRLTRHPRDPPPELLLS